MSLQEYTSGTTSPEKGEHDRRWGPAIAMAEYDAWLRAPTSYFDPRLALTNCIRIHCLLAANAKKIRMHSYAAAASAPVARQALQGASTLNPKPIVTAFLPGAPSSLFRGSFKKPHRIQCLENLGGIRGALHA